MSKDTDTGPVRDARMAAKKLVHKGETTYQQALDIVARDHGHRNWSAFIRAETGTTGTPGTRSNGSTGRRRTVDNVETYILEDTARNRKITPWLPLWTQAPGSAFLSIMLYSAALFGGKSMMVAGAAAAIVALVALVARFSDNGLMRPRHAIRKWVTPLAFCTWMVGASLIIGMLVVDGVGRLGIDGLVFGQPWPVRIYMAGLFGYYVSTRAHRAMTLARPESVKPERLPDATIPATEAYVSKRTGAVIRITTYIGLGLAFLGLAGMGYTIVDMLIHRAVDMTLAGRSLGLVMAGVFLSMMFSLGMGLDRENREFHVEDASKRAARAKRFLAAGRRVGHG